MQKLINLINRAKSRFDLTDPDSQKSLYALTEKLLALGDLDEKQLLRNNDYPLEFRIALHLRRSRLYALEIKRSVKVAVVFAMWGEHHRLRPKSGKNPNGEDTLRTKVDQLNWNANGTGIDWHLYLVDDGCPYGSGKVAESIIQTLEDSDRVRLMYLDQAAPAQAGPLRNLQSADDSKKGGSIILGAHQAILDGAEVVIYTDADNSVHLGQIGILLWPYIKENMKVVLGNRKDPLSVLVKQESRWGIGIKLLRHMQRMVGASIFSTGIKDSQAAFKLYSASILKHVISDPAVFDFSFDSDWIAAIIHRKEPFSKVPFAFVDSFAESASIVQGPMTTWETLLLGLVKAVRHRDLPHNENMARVLEEEIKSSADLDILINHLPPQLESVEDALLGNEEIMSPEDVREWIKLRKQEEKEGVSKTNPLSG